MGESNKLRTKETDHLTPSGEGGKENAERSRRKGMDKVKRKKKR